MTKKNTRKSPEPSPLLGSKDFGHWKYTGKFRVSEQFGFVYCITRRSDGKFYIGKKQLKVQGLKKSKDYGKEKAWRFYSGSSSYLNGDIEKLGKDAFDFEIIDLYKTRGGLHYAEAYLQMVSECLTTRLPNKEQEFGSYNGQIAAIRYIPQEELTDRTRRYPAKIKRKIKSLCESS